MLGRALVAGLALWTAAGSAKAANNPSLKGMQDGAPPGGTQSATDQVPSSDDAPPSRGGEGRMEGASRAENLAEVDFRKLADPEQVAQAHDAAAQLAKLMRTRLTRRDLARRRGYRLDLRRTIHRNISRVGTLCHHPVMTSCDTSRHARSGTRPIPA